MTRRGGTLAGMVEALRSMDEVPPDPLNGATELVAPPELVGQAHQLATAIAAFMPTRTPIYVKESVLMPVNTILGMRDGSIVYWSKTARPDPEQAHLLTAAAALA